MAPTSRTWAQIAAGVQVSAVPPVEKKTTTKTVEKSIQISVQEEVTSPSLNDDIVTLVTQEEESIAEDTSKIKPTEGKVKPPSFNDDIVTLVTQEVESIVEDTSKVKPVEIMTQECMQNLGEAHTAACVSVSDLHLVHPNSDRDDMSSSTAASDRDVSQSCIVCSGSGLLWVGFLSDLCPLCEKPMESESEHTPNTRHASNESELSLCREESSCKVQSQFEGLTKDSEANASEQESLGKRQDIVEEPSRKIGVVTSPPGLGPPGTWIWYDTKAEVANEEACHETRNSFFWPDCAANCYEVEFLGMVAQSCFGEGFRKMMVSWVVEECEADIELHLELTSTHSLTPLVLLQLALGREQSYRSCHLYKMEHSDDNTTMHFTCSQVTKDTCWDALKVGGCPRPNCPWEHPVPILFNVSCNVDTSETAMATSIPSVPTMANVQSKTSFNFPVRLVDQMIALNMSAYSSEEEEDP